MPQASKSPTKPVHPAHARPSEKAAKKKAKPATAARLATMTFQAWPEAIAAVGTGEKWVNDMREKAFPLVLGLHTLSFDDVALADRVRTGDEKSADAALDLAQWLNTQATAFRALAGFCETAETRLMCVLARIALERDAAQAVQS